MSNKLTVELIQNGVAKCEREDETFVYIDASALPQGVKSGDIIIKQGDEYLILKQQTDERKQNMLDLQSRIFKKKKS